MSTAPTATNENFIQFELVSPEEKLVSEPVKLAVMPGEAGEFGAGLHHVPMVAALKYGVVKLYAKSLDDLPRCIFITGGFVDVAGAQCVVLAEDAVDVKDLGTVEALEKKLARQREDLTLAAEEGDRLRMQAQIDLTLAQIKAVETSPVSKY